MIPIAGQYYDKKFETHQGTWSFLLCPEQLQKNVKKTFGNINVMSNFSKRSIFKFLVSKQCLNPRTNFQVHWADSY